MWKTGLTWDAYQPVNTPELGLPLSTLHLPTVSCQEEKKNLISIRYKLLSFSIELNSFSSLKFMLAVGARQHPILFPRTKSSLYNAATNLNLYSNFLMSSEFVLAGTQPRHFWHGTGLATSWKQNLQERSSLPPATGWRTPWDRTDRMKPPPSQGNNLSAGWCHLGIFLLLHSPDLCSCTSLHWGTSWEWRVADLNLSRLTRAQCATPCFSPKRWCV